MTTIFATTPQVISFFAQPDRLVSLASPQLRAVLDGVMFEPGEWQAPGNLGPNSLLSRKDFKLPDQSRYAGLGLSGCCLKILLVLARGNDVSKSPAVDAICSTRKTLFVGRNLCGSRLIFACTRVRTQDSC